MATSKNLDLDKIIEEMDFKALLRLAVQNRNKRNAFSFSDYLNKRKENIPNVIMGLTKLLMMCMEKYFAGNGQSDWAITDNENCNTVSQIIQAVADIGMISLQLNVSSHCQVELAMLLNGILSEVPSRMEIVKNSIAQYCEELYATNTFTRCEYFLFNVLTYLLGGTLSRKPTKIDIMRLYKIRKMIGPIMELKESNSEVLWNLFMECAVKAFYVSSVEGQKILGLVMALDINKVSEFHKVIRNNLPGSNIKIAAGYGRIYFVAWYFCMKMGKQDIKNVLEITCFKCYIELAINTRHIPCFCLVRKLLAQFHSHKKETEVSKVLCSVFQPLLWRYLKNPDGQIRANAAQLFLDVFPIEDPDEGVVATDLQLNDQLLMIRELLLDVCPIVRVTTILGMCVLMSVHWEIIPEEMLKTYFRIIVDDLSHDLSSAEIRVAVVKGIKCLLKNPATVNSLVGIFPKLQDLFNDSSENVRIAFCQLLLKVKKISAIKFFHIVSTKHLFAHLKEDSHAVKKNISKLLNNSYFPTREDTKVWIARCLEIIKHERAAAKVFFSYIATFIGLENSIRFMVQTVKAVHFYVRTKQSSGRIELSNKENINYNEDAMPLKDAVGFSNFDVVSSIMDSITALWLSLKTEIEQPEHKACLKWFVKGVGKPLAELCLYYKDTSAWESVFYLSSYLPASIVPCLGSLCFWKLKNLSSDAEEREYMTLVDCLCNQQQGLELLTLLKEWIETGLSDSCSISYKKRLGYKFAVIVGKVLDYHAAAGQSKYIEENETVMLCTLLESLCKLFDCYSDENLLESMSAQELKELKFNLSNVIQIVHNHVALLKAPTSSIFRCILKIILDSVISKTSSIVDNMTDDNFDSITYPKVGAFFMSVMTQKPTFLPMYMKFLNEAYENSAKDIPFWIACYSIISRVVNRKASAKQTVKECSILVRNLEKTLLETYPCEKDSDPLNSTKNIPSIPIQMFEKHCYSEFSKLKKRVLNENGPSYKC